jgi:hypothetical protein
MHAAGEGAHYRLLMLPVLSNYPTGFIPLLLLDLLL